jgi:hypothetical protein
MTATQPIETVEFNPSEDSPIRLPKGGNPQENARHYEACGLFAFENDKFHKSDVYYEWARLERLKII